MGRTPAGSLEAESLIEKHKKWIVIALITMAFILLMFYT